MTAGVTIDGTAFPGFPIADGVALADVSAALPQHQTKHYAQRRKAIRRVYVHHSGAGGQTGIDGAINCADYTIHARDWASIPYHYWLDERGIYDDAGRLVVLQTQPPGVITYHTGGLNTAGLGVALQGNKNREPVTEAQNHALDALLSWLLMPETLPSLDAQSPIGWHSIADTWGGSMKPTCPGTNTEAWLEQWLSARGLGVPGRSNAA